MKKQCFVLIVGLVAVAESIAVFTLLKDPCALGRAAGLPVYNDRIVLFVLTHSAGLFVRGLSWLAGCVA
jgi:hypothetical protein